MTRECSVRVTEDCAGVSYCIKCRMYAYIHTFSTHTHTFLQIALAVSAAIHTYIHTYMHTFSTHTHTFLQIALAVSAALV